MSSPSPQKRWTELPQQLAQEMVRTELRKRLSTNPLQWAAAPDGRIVPLRLTPIQQQASQRAPGRKIFGLIGGNRLGKSLWASCYVTAVALGIPQEQWPTLPADPLAWPLAPSRITIWCVTVTYEKSRDGQQQFLWERIPRPLWRSTWRPSSGFHNNVATLRNGAKFVFKSQDQELRTFETSTVDLVWIDETVDESVLLALLPRLVDRGGQIVWTTIFDDPLLDDLFCKRRLSHRAEKMLTAEQVDWVGGSMYDNPHLPRAEVQFLEETLPDVEREIRVHGRPAFYQGLVYGDYDETRHIETVDLPLPEEWTLDEAIDPGWDNPCAVLFGAVDALGVLHVHDEIYERRRTVGEIAAMIQLKRWIHRGIVTPDEVAEFQRLIERPPAESPGQHAARGDELKRVLDEWRRRYGECRPRRCLIDEYARQTDQAKTVPLIDQFRAFGIHAQPASNRDKPAQEMAVRERLRPMAGQVRLRVNYYCRWMRFEFTHYRIKPKDPASGEHLSDRERRIEAHNHLMSCLEYWVSSRPSWEKPAAREPRGMIERHEAERQREQAVAGGWRRRG